MRTTEDRMEGTRSEPWPHREQGWGFHERWFPACPGLMAVWDTAPVAGWSLLGGVVGLGMCYGLWRWQTRGAGAVAGSGGSAVSAYSPKNVGNDASARPWERVGDGAVPVSAVAQSVQMPEGLDLEAFLDQSRRHFLQLQAAWNRGDVSSLRAMMSSTMLDEVQSSLAAYENHALAGGQTEFDVLELRVLHAEVQDGQLHADIEFSGVAREESAAGPAPFREIWSIERPVQNPDAWLVTGVQALQ